MIILGKYGDEFSEKLYEKSRALNEKVSYFPYSYTLFSNDELLPRFCDRPYMAITAGGDIRFPPQAKKVRSSIKSDPNVVLVVRGASGYKWKPVHEVLNAYISSRYLKKEMGANHITIVLPNMPFGKQDHLFYDHESGSLIDGAPITVRYIRELLREYANLLISFNPHDFRDKTGWIVKNEKTIPGTTKDDKGRILDSNGRVILEEPEDWTGFAYAIDATEVLIRYMIKSKPNPLFIGPDKSVADIIRRHSTNALIADKIRDRNERLNVASTIELLDDMRGYDAILVDDLIQAGTTMNNIVRILRAHIRPPKSIMCGAVNGEFVYNRKLGKSAFDILTESGTEVVVTDTIETPVSRVSVVPLLAKKLYELIK